METSKKRNKSKIRGKTIAGITVCIEAGDVTNRNPTPGIADGQGAVPGLPFKSYAHPIVNPLGRAGFDQLHRCLRSQEVLLSLFRS